MPKICNSVLIRNKNGSGKSRILAYFTKWVSLDDLLNILSKNSDETNGYIIGFEI